jgi:hypothetical protein
VDFLEQHNEYALTFHRVNYISSFEKLVQPNSPHLSKASFNTIDLISDNFIPTLSALFRNINIDFSFIQHCPVGDYPMFLMISLHGKLHYNHKIMATYRRHEGGVWSTKSDLEMLVEWIKMQNYLCELMPSEHRVFIIENQIIRLRDYFNLTKNDSRIFFENFTEIPLGLSELPNLYISSKEQSPLIEQICDRIKSRISNFKSYSYWPFS